MKSALNPPCLESRVVSIYHLHFPAHRPSSIALCVRRRTYTHTLAMRRNMYLNGGEFTNFLKRDIYLTGTRFTSLLNEYLLIISIIYY